ncbi:alpha/beta hydrolase [Mucilaginibacter sp.]|uniref:alpha/beta hydrolase n=1 Tax=Mucilaginibacter sp. TaxID=1882438 RepID=UPI003D12ED15
MLKYMLIGLLATTIYTASAQKEGKTEEIPLWHGNMPDGPGPQGIEQVSAKGSVTNVSQPRLIIHLPQHPNGTAILVISGGGYAHIEQGNESGPAANWLQAEGVTAFELIYRLPGEGWAKKTVPFQDAQRAMRLIRSMAAKYNLNPDRIGILGFSAGGHLAGITETMPGWQFYRGTDAIDNLSARPDFAALIYPVLTMMPPYNQTHSRKEIIGNNPSEAKEKEYSVELHVNSNTPKTFLAQATDDPISSVNNSLLMDSALHKAGVADELHIFPSGGHGWGMGKPGSPVAAWPALFRKWAKQNGFWE